MVSQGYTIDSHSYEAKSFTKVHCISVIGFSAFWFTEGLSNFLRMMICLNSL